MIPHMRLIISKTFFQSCKEFIQPFRTFGTSFIALRLGHCSYCVLRIFFTSGNLETVKAHAQT